MRVVVALGGNALLKRGEPLTADNQRRNMRAAAAPLAHIARGHELVIVHGNGPQVGLLALEGEAYKDVPPYPLDVLGAESQGMIGYVIAQELARELAGRSAVTLITQTRIAADDPALSHPTKPIGPVYDEVTAHALAEERGWSIARDGNKWRRVVPSPAPQAIVELDEIRCLLESGAVPICAGGGGIPVVEAPGGAHAGIEAVIDKDRAAAVLALALDADRLIILTDVDAVYEDWNGKREKPIRALAASAIDPANYPAGSMGPKLDAAASFASASGKEARIGALSEAVAVFEGNAGTAITP